ncbi:hypothetical protein N0V90_007280 [Kalmusia sp. IMI 367209]|nr:hypothetical protein N0V90_007280 [Kalmusia sp. IMI 367209]
MASDDSCVESSPDPLLASITETRIRAPKQALTSSSPSKQNRRPSIDLYSPSKQMEQLVLNTPRTGGASPWRIKVTVQAEPGSDAENMDSPSVRRVTRTKTTTIPLKDADAPSPVKRRGRPRKSDAATPAQKRSGTPVRKRAASKTRRPSVGPDSSAADAETDATPKKRRGRPRKTIPLPTDNESTPATQASSSQDIWTDISVADADTRALPNKRRGRPRNIARPSTEGEPTLVVEGSSPQTDSARKLKERQSTPATNGKVLIEVSSDEGTEQECDIHTPSDTDNEYQIPQRQQLEEATEHPHDLKSPEKPLIENFGCDDEEHEETYFALDEGATRMPDDTTIIDSENFSMISVDSLPSGGSLTSPANGSTGATPTATDHTSIQNHAYLSIPSTGLHGKGSPRTDTQPSPAPPCATIPSPQAKISPLAAPPRYKTPSVEPCELFDPPLIEPARLSPTEAQTPKIGRVVKAGVALQGVLDPNRVSPEAKTTDERRDHLDDLFRGFSEKTRRELQAGLRLGEQLARQHGSTQLSSPSLSSPIKAIHPSCSDEDPFPPNIVSQQSRLLTPEERDDFTASATPPIEVQYPPLRTSNQDSHLLSPAPIVSRAGNARSDEDPHIQDLFAPDGFTRPARGKLPRTWRRESSGDFQYSDEAEVSEMITPPPTESDESPALEVDKEKSRLLQSTVVEELEDEFEDESDRSDDTGMFFQSNMPHLFRKKGSSKLERKSQTQKVDLTSLLDQSLLPESSPPPASQTPVMNKQNPFTSIPPQFSTLLSSPVKGSPLRQELRGSDISSGSAQQLFDESTLPLAPSSPFHTFVEGDTARSMASDQRQLMRELGETDSSLRRIRDEADDYLDAYEPQERTLHDLTEVTEPSRTWHKDTTRLTSSPPKQILEESILRSDRTHVPLFKGHSSSNTQLSHYVLSPGSNNASDKATTTATARTINKEPALPSAGISSHLSSAPSTAMRTAFSPSHPALKKLDYLPKVEPWTKTHYKVLDALYQLYKKQPKTFSPTNSVNADINAALLSDFLKTTELPFIDARYRAWGYSVIFTGPLVVLCAAYMQLLTLEDMSEYENLAGKEIQIGDCGPGAIGDEIVAEKVVERLATIILGEAVRRDEKKGKMVDKSGWLKVEWPQ